VDSIQWISAVVDHCAVESFSREGDIRVVHDKLRHTHNHSSNDKCLQSSWVWGAPLVKDLWVGNTEVRSTAEVLHGETVL
jgi:hypothetical protein